MLFMHIQYSMMHDASIMCSLSPVACLFLRPFMATWISILDCHFPSPSHLQPQNGSTDLVSYALLIWGERGATRSSMRLEMVAKIGWCIQAEHGKETRAIVVVACWWELEPPPSRSGYHTPLVQGQVMRLEMTDDA